jgi:hypothetical protein
MARRGIIIPPFRPVGKMPAGAGLCHLRPALPFAIYMATPITYSDPFHPSIFIPRGATLAVDGNLRRNAPLPLRWDCGSAVSCKPVVKSGTLPPDRLRDTASGKSQ